MYQQERKYIGDMSQLFLVKEYCYTSGKGAGLRAVDVANGSGLSLTVAKDRGMDLQYLSYKGINLGFVTPAGVVAPQYYSDKGLDFLHSFTAGMLTTCGLQYFGAPCSDAGRSWASMDAFPTLLQSRSVWKFKAIQMGSRSLFSLALCGKHGCLEPTSV